MQKTAESGVVGALLRTLGKRVLLPIAASGMGMSGQGDVATAIAGNTAWLAKPAALDRNEGPTQEAVAGAASGMSVANVMSGSNCGADAETEAIASRFPLTIVVKVDVISDTLVDKIVGVESGGRNDAKNPNSSALGQGQFINATWLAMVRKHKPGWAEGLTIPQILGKRKEQDASRWVIKAYAKENAPKLQGAGVGVDEASLYLAHMFDGPVAVKLYKAKPNAEIKDIVGAAAFKANRNLFAGKKVIDLISWAQAKMRGGPRLVGGVTRRIER